MPKYIIERDYPDAFKMDETELKELSLSSCQAINKIGTGIQWLHSYVTDHKIFCVYIADNEEVLMKHARIVGFPVSSIRIISNIIDPSTSE